VFCLLILHISNVDIPLCFLTLGCFADLMCVGTLFYLGAFLVRYFIKLYIFTSRNLILTIPSVPQSPYHSVGDVSTNF